MTGLLDEGLIHAVVDHSPCPHSVANFREAVVERIALELDVDFGREVFAGLCELHIRVLCQHPAPSHVVLDVLHLDIESVVLQDGESAEWQVRQPSGTKAHFGSGLVVRLPAGAEAIVLRVKYMTTSRSTAIQWLAPEQTQGKVHPLCFTQSQAICGRSLLPCQDTPSVKAPFTITVTAPKPLVALASGQPDGPVEEDAARGVRKFRYRQQVPVMSYLLAALVGDLEERDIGPRSKVYAEPSVVGAAQLEFKDIVEEYILAAQRVVGGSAYMWGSYNVAVLPSSFAYGGMENPNCTFMSASLIAGDRSLTTTLAHEITHSWTGNLVTNAYWKDFWLNEGFTRYIERRVLGDMYGQAFRGLLLVVGYNDLMKNVEMLTKLGTPQLTRLEPELESTDPDDAFSRVPYEKGSLFLFYLESLVGGPERMTEWLRAYVDEFRNKSIETSDFQKHLLKFFTGVPGVEQVDWQHWLHGDGLPNFDLVANVDTGLLQLCRDLADAWLAGSPEKACSAEEFSQLRAQQVMVFLDHLINAANDGNAEKLDLAAIDQRYGLSSTRNVEVAYRWCMLGCKCRWPGVLPTVAGFLSTHGRGAYVKPLYLALQTFDSQAAREAFDRNRGFYMTVITSQIRKIVEV